jgi:hypothetical protein
MDLASVFYLGSTVLMLAVFLFIIVRTYRGANRQRGEAPKFRMMDDD